MVRRKNKVALGVKLYLNTIILKISVHNAFLCFLILGSFWWCLKKTGKFSTINYSIHLLTLHALWHTKFTLNYDTSSCITTKRDSKTEGLFSSWPQQTSVFITTGFSLFVFVLVRLDIEIPKRTWGPHVCVSLVIVTPEIGGDLPRRISRKKYNTSHVHRFCPPNGSQQF